MIQAVLKFQLERPTNPYTTAWMSTRKEVGILIDFPTRQSLNKALTNVSVDYVLQVKADHTTMRVNHNQISGLPFRIMLTTLLLVGSYAASEAGILSFS